MRRPRQAPQDPIRSRLNYWLDWFSSAQDEEFREREDDGLRIVDEAELEALKRLGHDTTYVVLSDESRLKILLRELRAKRPGPIEEAAAHLGLDPEGAGDRETLLLVLADMVCAKEEPKARRTPGRRKGTAKWDMVKLSLLGLRYEHIKRRHPKMSDRQIAKEIRLAHSSTDYKFDTEETIRQKLPAAKREFAEFEKRHPRFAARTRLAEGAWVGDWEEDW